MTKLLQAIYVPSNLAIGYSDRGGMKYMWPSTDDPRISVVTWLSRDIY